MVLQQSVSLQISIASETTAVFIYSGQNKPVVTYVSFVFINGKFLRIIIIIIISSLVTKVLLVIVVFLKQNNICIANLSYMFSFMLNALRW